MCRWVHRSMTNLAGGQVVAGSNPVSPTHSSAQGGSEKFGAAFFRPQQSSVPLGSCESGLPDRSLSAPIEPWHRSSPGGVDRLRCCSTIPTERVLSDAVEVGVVVESLRRVGRFSLCAGGVLSTNEVIAWESGSLRTSRIASSNRGCLSSSAARQAAMMMSASGNAVRRVDLDGDTTGPADTTNLAHNGLCALHFDVQLVECIVRHRHLKSFGAQTITGSV